MATHDGRPLKNGCSPIEDEDRLDAMKQQFIDPSQEAWIAYELKLPLQEAFSVPSTCALTNTLPSLSLIVAWNCSALAIAYKGGDYVPGKAI